MASATVCWRSSVVAPFVFAAAKWCFVQGPHPDTADADSNTNSFVFGSSTSS